MSPARSFLAAAALLLVSTSCSPYVSVEPTDTTPLPMCGVETCFEIEAANSRFLEYAYVKADACGGERPEPILRVWDRAQRRYVDVSRFRHETGRDLPRACHHPRLQPAPRSFDRIELPGSATRYQLCFAWDGVTTPAHVAVFAQGLTECGAGANYDPEAPEETATCEQCAPEVERGGILVVAAHPDDDVLTAAGVIAAAVERGEAVRVVYLTNGDVEGVAFGLARQDAAVAAEALLGVSEENLVFLGYPDTGLYDLLTSYASPGAVLNHLGQTTTYGRRGLGGSDYHTHRFGSPATYNGENLTADLADLLALFRPDHVVVTSDEDAHLDHKAAYHFLRNALARVRAADAGYDPVLHKTVVFADGDWPLLTSPDELFSPIPAMTDLRWSQRESLDVPLAMASADLDANPKNQAFLIHAPLGSYDIYRRFLHHDEIFWAEMASGFEPPVSNAGSDQKGARGALVVLDGSGSHDADGPIRSWRWRQIAGPQVELHEADTPHPSFVVPDSLDHPAIAVFELVVADERVASLPDTVRVLLGSDLEEPVDDPGVNVAPRARAFASSENAAASQLASSAIDGVVGGYPSAPAHEWATVGEREGAWLELVWTEAVVVDRIVLHDRPNADDHVLAGTLRFDDGTTLEVGPLDNAGGPTVVRFPPREILSVRFTVVAASASTVNVGLAEIEVRAPVP